MNWILFLNCRCPFILGFPQADEIPVLLFLLFLLGMNYLSRS